MSVLIMTIQVSAGLGSEKQQAVLLGELRGGKGMTQDSSRCAGLSVYTTESLIHQIPQAGTESPL